MKCDEWILLGNNCMMRSYDWMMWCAECGLSANDYKIWFNYWFVDLRLGLWKELWISGGRAGFC